MLGCFKFDRRCRCVIKQSHQRLIHIFSFKRGDARQYSASNFVDRQPKPTSDVNVINQYPTFDITAYITTSRFVTAMVYFGLAMNSTNLGGNVYLDFILVQLVDWPSIILCIVVLDPWGRKFCSSLWFLLAGVGSIASGLCSGTEGGLDTDTGRWR